MNDVFWVKPTHPPPPPTQWEKDVEAARRRTLEQYHNTFYSPSFDKWYLNEPQDPYIAARVKDLYVDNRQTTRQYGVFYAASLALPGGQPDQDESLTPTPHRLPDTRTALDTTALGDLYDRILDLYKERCAYIHGAAIHRLVAWNGWYQENASFGVVRNDQKIAACESTLAFMEDDYIKRKVDFVIEVYALLEDHDGPRAAAVLAELGETYPWLGGDFTSVVENYVIDYGAVRSALAAVQQPGTLEATAGMFGQAWENAREDDSD